LSAYKKKIAQNFSNLNMITGRRCQCRACTTAGSSLGAGRGS